jgi:hypothetical protein
MRPPPSARTAAVAVAALASLAALPGRAAAGEARIEDNSFLIEEAYNQEPGVLHHIQTFMRSWTTGQWLYTFTEEWPVGGEDHQVSVVLPLSRVDGASGSSAGVGDVSLNYRWAYLQEERLPAVAVVRATVFLPTGERARALGEGRPGAQLALPVSVKLGERFVDHVNLWGTWFPDSWGGATYGRSTGWGAGNGLVWLALPAFNPMLEVYWAEAQRKVEGGPAISARTLLLNPAFRTAINFQSGLQIVWGLGAPIGIGPSRGDRSLFLYLSFEHPWSSRAAPDAPRG